MNVIPALTFAVMALVCIFILILPDYKNGDLLLVCNDSTWFIRYFSHFGKSGEVYVYDGQRKEGYTKCVLKHKLADFKLPD